MTTTPTIFVHALMALWLLLPAGFANMSPIIAAHLPVIKHWSSPLDLGASYRGVRIFGDNKTWRGLVAGVVTASVIWCLEVRFASHLPFFPLVESNASFMTLLPGWLLGPLLGFGALAGDAVKSFFKRRRGLAPGENWLFIDQIDSLVGAAILSLLVIVLPIQVYAIALLGWPLLNLAISYIGHLIRLKERFL